MGEGRPVVVGVDGTPDSDLAVRWAAEEARRRETWLRLVHAYSWSRYSVLLRLSGQDAQDAATAARRRAHRMLAISMRQVDRWRDGLHITREAIDGDRVRVLLHTSAAAAVVVVGSRRLGTVDSVVLGSVGSALAAQGACPTVVVRGDPSEVTAGAPVVAGIDGGELNDAVLGYAFDHASRFKRPLRILLFWRPSLVLLTRWTDGLVGELRDRKESAATGRVLRWREKYPDVSVELEVAEGHPVDGLVQAAAAAHLLVVGAQGTHALPGMLLGSVSQGVLHHATCPVAVIHGQDLAA